MYIKWHIRRSNGKMHILKLIALGTYMYVDDDICELIQLRQLLIAEQNNFSKTKRDLMKHIHHHDGIYINYNLKLSNHNKIPRLLKSDVENLIWMIDHDIQELINK